MTARKNAIASDQVAKPAERKGRGRPRGDTPPLGSTERNRLRRQRQSDVVDAVDGRLLQRLVLIKEANEALTLLQMHWGRDGKPASVEQAVNEGLIAAAAAVRAAAKTGAS